MNKSDNDRARLVCTRKETPDSRATADKNEILKRLRTLLSKDRLMKQKSVNER